MILRHSLQVNPSDVSPHKTTAENNSCSRATTCTVCTLQPVDHIRHSSAQLSAPKGLSLGPLYSPMIWLTSDKPIKFAHIRAANAKSCSNLKEGYGNGYGYPWVSKFFVNQNLCSRGAMQVDEARQVVTAGVNMPNIVLPKVPNFSVYLSIHIPKSVYLHLRARGHLCFSKAVF